MNDIAFLHTSPVHVATFGALMQELAPHRRATHHVREDLLACAQRQGLGDASLNAAVGAALQHAATEARVVVCTCSTIGGLAEDAQQSLPHARITRIDRAMADEAVRLGAPVLMVAAVQSTLQPTAELLRSSAARQGRPLALRSWWIEGAWTHFEAGRREAYLEAVAAGALQAAKAGETIVLAQASMAGAAVALQAAGFVALSSPRLGVEHAVRLAAEA